MTILIIHNYYRQRGGEDSVFEIESEALAEAGHRVIKYTRHNCEVDKFTFWQKVTFPISAFKNRISLKELEKIITSNTIDIAHIHNVFPLITPHIYKLLKKRNIKVVQTIHNYRFLCPSGQLIRKAKNCTLCLNGRFFNCVIHRCYKKSFIFSLIYALVIMRNQGNFINNIDAYITPTDFPKTLLLKQGYPGHKIHVKDNAIRDRPLRGPLKKGNYFLFMGRLSEEKGIQFLLETFKDLPEQTLVVAGTSENYQEIVTKYKSKNITFKGFVDGEEKVKLIGGAIALIVPSLWFENYPISIVEAFHYRTPVIGSNIGGIPHIITDNHDGLLFEHNNRRSLVEKIRFMAGDKNRQAEMSNNARKTFLKRMEITANIKRLEAIYRNL